MIEAYNDKIKWTWVPECDMWCWPESAPGPEAEAEMTRAFEENGHWVRTSRLEYLVREGVVLPVPQELPQEITITNGSEIDSTGSMKH